MANSVEGSHSADMGLSGSGKSTLVRHINRLIAPTADPVSIGGHDVSAMRPDELILMDEAFSGVDPLIRSQLQAELLSLQAELGRTVVFITRELDEVSTDLVRGLLAQEPLGSTRMRRLLLPLATLLSGVGLQVIGVGLLLSVLGLRAGLAESSTITTGMAMSACFVGFVFGTVF